MVEHAPEKRGVTGSTPVPTTEKVLVRRGARIEKPGLARVSCPTRAPPCPTLVQERCPSVVASSPFLTLCGRVRRPGDSLMLGLTRARQCVKLRLSRPRRLGGWE